MRYVICMESSHQRGMGHLFRGLNLAKAFKSESHKVAIVINDDKTSWEIIRKEGFDFEIATYSDTTNWEFRLIEKYRPHWWINDRLDTTVNHAKKVCNSGISLATFDDHGDGANFAQYNFLAMDLLPEKKSSNGYYGPKYIILNPQIKIYKKTMPNHTINLDILITLGGSDTYGVTPRVLNALRRLANDVSFTIIIGPNFEHQKELSTAIKNFEKQIKVYHDVPDLINFMSRSDLIICGGGITLFEAAALGLPALTIANEPHEIHIIEWFEVNGCSINLGFHKSKFEDRLLVETMRLIENKDSLLEMSEKGMSLVDCKGLSRILRLLRKDKKNRSGCNSLT
jgi:spore coat polysaccharide biosynthesis predicted glycosyltransferase SpsG